MSTRSPSRGGLERFRDIGYEDFRRFASDPSMNRYEKIGFPSSYRRGFEKKILLDVTTKLTGLRRPRSTILDIGCGCSGLPGLLMARAAKLRQRLVLVDSPEMLAQLPTRTGTRKVEGRFPDMPEFRKEFHGKADSILVYSVIQYVFAEGNLFSFLDKAVSLLRPGGELLIGDIPNVGKRKRFFSTEAGIAFHRKFMRTRTAPRVNFPVIEEGAIDDSVVLSILLRYRTGGLESYLLPQSADLPMANRREDILIRKP